MTLDASVAVYNALYGIVNSSGTLYTRSNNTANNNTNGDTSGTLTALGGV